MKDLTEKLKIDIDRLDSELSVYLEKYKVGSAFKLLQAVKLEEADIRPVYSAIFRKDALTHVMNLLNHGYSPEIFEDDPDESRMRRAIYSVAGHLFETSVTDERVPAWSKLDANPTSRIVESVEGCIMADELELAALGLVYAIYQKKFQRTNKADEKIKQLFDNKKEGN